MQVTIRAQAMCIVTCPIVTRHASHVTCHTSHISLPTSHVTRHPHFSRHVTQRCIAELPQASAAAEARRDPVALASGLAAAAAAAAAAESAAAKSAAAAAATVNAAADGRASAS